MKNINTESYSALLFDLDGTLADTMPLHNQAWIETLQDYGCPMTNEILSEYAGIPNAETVEIFNRRFQWRLDPVTIAETKETRAIEKLKAVLPQDLRIESTIEIASQYFGKKPMAVVSGGSRSLVELVLQKLMIRKYFSVLVCAESTTKHKPNPEPFLFAARELNVAPNQCLVFEDGQAGIQSAQSCGMSVILVGPDFMLSPLSAPKRNQ